MLVNFVSFAKENKKKKKINLPFVLLNQRISIQSNLFQLFPVVHKYIPKENFLCGGAASKITNKIKEFNLKFKF